MHFFKKTSILHRLPKTIQMDSIPLPGLIKQLRSPNVMVVEIGKNPTRLFKQGVWIGNKTGGMSSWLNTILPHLPFNKFYLYVDQAALEQRVEVEYLNEYFKKLFYKNYQGFCLSSRQEVDSTMLDKVSTLSVQQMRDKLSSKNKVALIDVRTSEQVRRDPMENFLQRKDNIRYINIPINDEELGQKFHYSTEQLEGKWELITMCARGYRSMIAYSTYRHFCQPKWNLTVCTNSYGQIKQALKQQ